MNKEDIKAKLVTASIAVGVLGVLGAATFFALSLVSRAITVSLEPEDDEGDWWI